MLLGRIEIFVSNPLKAKLFYTEILGFEEIIIQQEQFVWLKLGKTEVLLRPSFTKKNTSEFGEKSIVMVFYTDDLDKTKMELEDKGLVFSGIDGSNKCPTFVDEDGNWFQLVNPNDH